MSQSRRVATAFRQDAASPPGHASATTAEGLAGERALIAARFGKTARTTQAARRLKHAARADARAA